MEKFLEEYHEIVNQQFVEALSRLIAQMEAQSDSNQETKAMGEKLREIY